MITAIKKKRKVKNKKGKEKLKALFSKINYTLRNVQKEAVWDGVLRKDSMWAFADQGSYKMTLRKTLKNWDKCKITADELTNVVNEKFSAEKLHERFVDSILQCLPEDEDNESWMNEIESIINEYE